MAGTPAHWRTSDSDADRNPEFVAAWMQSFDALSPWTVGRYSDQTSADAFAEDRIQGDVMFIARWGMEHGRRVDYMPVVHPGGSVRRPSLAEPVLMTIQRASTRLMGSGRGMPHHAKVAVFCGDRYTMLANGGRISCTAPCGMNMMKAHSFCPPLRKLPTSLRIRNENSSLSHMMWTGMTYRQIGTCGLRAMDPSWSRTSVSSRIDSQRRNCAIGRTRIQSIKPRNSCSLAGAAAGGQADKDSRMRIG